MNRDKAEVRSVYAAIIKQSIYDWEKAKAERNIGRQMEIRKFYRSEWAKIILHALELDINIINDKYNILPELTKEERK